MSKNVCGSRMNSKAIWLHELPFKSGWIEWRISAQVLRFQSLLNLPDRLTVLRYLLKYSQFQWPSCETFSNEPNRKGHRPAAFWFSLHSLRHHMPRNSHSLKKRLKIIFLKLIMPKSWPTWGAHQLRFVQTWHAKNLPSTTHTLPSYFRGKGVGSVDRSVQLKRSTSAFDWIWLTVLKVWYKYLEVKYKPMPIMKNTVFWQFPFANHWMLADEFRIYGI